MIYQQKNIVPIGSIVKTHGVQGALLLRLFEGFNFSILNNSEYCFLMIRSKPVPFKMDDMFESNATDIVLQFHDFATKPEAEQFLNLEVAVEQNKPVRKQKTEHILSLLGYKIFNDKKLVGTIQDIENTGMQLLFVLEDDLLIPAHDDLIDVIDKKKKIVYMNLPDGLI
ncbi:MAG: ribosome maturation factor RimM [Bacteroidetes bacterium]|nr:ribosome maturation factor RimM [Bacteroidota bacterium]